MMKVEFDETVILAIIEIKEVKSGKVCCYAEERLFVSIDYYHREGNYSCDCNRRKGFTRCLYGTEIPESPCGEGDFLLNVYGENAEPIYIEFGDDPITP